MGAPKRTADSGWTNAAAHLNRSARRDLSDVGKVVVSRDILYDRYAGLEMDDGDGGEWTDLQRALSGTLGDLVQGTARCHRDDASPILDELYDLIRDHVVRRVDELGLATSK
jgi:hypothetical protein